MALTYYRKSCFNDIRYLADDAHIICKSLNIPKEILLNIIKQLCISIDNSKFNFDVTFNKIFYLRDNYRGYMEAILSNGLYIRTNKITLCNKFICENNFHNGRYYTRNLGNINKYLADKIKDKGGNYPYIIGLNISLNDIKNLMLTKEIFAYRPSQYRSITNDNYNDSVYYSDDLTISFELYNKHFQMNEIY